MDKLPKGTINLSNATGPKPPVPRSLFEQYAAAVVYVVTEDPIHGESIGSAFHVGEGVFVTARHVVENRRILEIGNSISRRGGTLKSGPFFHPDPIVDVAAFIVEGIEAPIIPLGSHLDDWLADNDFILREVIVLGYPPIPLSDNPVIVASRGEVNAVVNMYFGGHPHFIISAIARGGFSGGVCLVEWDFALGLVTQSLTRDGHPEELGYMAVLSVEPIYTCLAHHKIMPTDVAEGWDDFWGIEKEDMYCEKMSDTQYKVHCSVKLNDDGRRRYLTVMSDRPDLFNEVSTKITDIFGADYCKREVIRVGMERFYFTDPNRDERTTIISAAESVHHLLLVKGLCNPDPKTEGPVGFHY